MAHGLKQMKLSVRDQNTLKHYNNILCNFFKTVGDKHMAQRKQLQTC